MYSRNGSSLDTRTGRSLAFGAPSVRRYLRTVFLDNPSSALIARMLSPWRLNTWISTYPSSRNMPGPSTWSGPGFTRRVGQISIGNPGSTYNRHRQRSPKACYTQLATCVYLLRTAHRTAHDHSDPPPIGVMRLCLCLT